MAYAPVRTVGVIREARSAPLVGDQGGSSSHLASQLRPLVTPTWHVAAVQPAPSAPAAKSAQEVEEAVSAGTTDSESDEWDLVGEEGKPAWHANVRPIWLLLAAATVVVRQCSALMLIVLEVLFSHAYLMNCDPREVGDFQACACEYTKAYVRSFPLLAIIVSIMAAMRGFLQQRLYYELLRHGALLDLTNVNPISDPIFKTILWCAGNACLHFVLSVWKAYFNKLDSFDLHLKKIQEGNFFHEVVRVSVFYMLPTVYFIAFLYGSYDTESTLIPLSKYFEANPEEARKNLNRMPMISEMDAVAAAEANILRDMEPVTNQVEAKKAYSKFIEVAQAKCQEREMEKTEIQSWIFLSLWPAQFLLRAKLRDRRSLNFRYIWLGFAAACIGVTGAVLYFFGSAIVKKSEDVIAGQWSDVFGLIVVVAHALVTIWMASRFIKSVIIPFRT